LAYSKRFQDKGRLKASGEPEKMPFEELQRRPPLRACYTKRFAAQAYQDTFLENKMNILRAETYLKQFGQGKEKLADVYDDDEMLSAALNTLFPVFEYPDFSHLTMDEVRARYWSAPRALS
jgi:hypothetical protein